MTGDLASLDCGLCSCLSQYAVVTPCCSRLACRKCAITSIIKSEGKCGFCHSSTLLISSLVPSQQVRRKVEEIEVWKEVTETESVDNTSHWYQDWQKSNRTALDDDTRETSRIDSKRIKLDKSIHSDLNLNEGNNAEFPREVAQIAVVNELQTTEVENEKTNCEIGVRKSAGTDVTTADVASNSPIADDENHNSFSKENSSKVNSASDESTKIIYYDLETTHFDNYNKHKGVEILQIGAITNIDGETFQQYILPTKPIPPDATNIHGIFMKKKDDSNELDWNSLYIKEDGVVRKVDAVDKRTGFNRFITWMETFQGKVTLAGYNSHWYDDWVLCHEMQGVVQKDRLPICSFADVSKIVRPVLEAKGIKKWKLGLAVSYLLKRGQDRAHEALSDARDCRDLLIKIGEMKNKTPQELLLGNRNSVKDFDDVWQVCMSMANLI